MASEKNICIDYAGRKIIKRLPQSTNPKFLVENLLKQNGLKVKLKDKNGYTEFICSHHTNRKQFILNIYFASYKFDSQRPNFVNINLGANIEDPYTLSLKDSKFSKTLILGIYVFDKNDLAQDAVFVSCPIKKRNYAGNPSLRVRNELIQEARKASDAIWTNNAGDDFRAFKLLSFPNVLNLNNLGIPSTLNTNATPTVNTNRSGPPPRQNTYNVGKIINAKAVVYVAKWGNTNIFKIGYSQNTVQRLKAFNQYIPDYELPSIDVWTLVYSKQFDSQKTAYGVEQKILNDPLLKNYNTVGERFKCDFSRIQKVINKHSS